MKYFSKTSQTNNNDVTRTADNILANKVLHGFWKFVYLQKINTTAHKAIDIAKKIIYKAQDDEPKGGDRMTNLKLQKLRKI